MMSNGAQKKKQPPMMQKVVKRGHSNLVQPNEMIEDGGEMIFQRVDQSDGKERKHSIL